jgi:hypothetical protein
LVPYILGGTTPDWDPFTGPATGVFSNILGSMWIGVWLFIAGLGLMKSKSWAGVAAMVCFTIILANGAIGVIQLIIALPTTFFTYWPLDVAVILVVFAAIGFLYLLLTWKRMH